MELKDRVAIITGGGSGLGEETCYLFAEQGAKVVVVDFNGEAAQRVADSIQSKNGQAIAVQVNVADHGKVEEMVQKVIDTYGKVDILINNAGITRDSTLKKMTDEQWHQVIDTNLNGVYYCARSVIPHMLEQGSGNIINTSSIVGTNGNFGQTNYAATKAALQGMAKTWAKEFGPKGIRANAVAPGFIATPMTAKMPSEVLEGMEKQVPLKRLGTPRDIAEAYLYLASDRSAYVNGHVLKVDGGLQI